jgi:hypothetical protein
MFMKQKGFYVKFEVLLIFMLLCVLTCQPPLQQAPGNQTNLETEVKEAVVNLDVLSRVTATCLSDNPEMLSIIHNEIGKRFDGDTQVLYETIKDTVLADGRTIHQTLCAAGTTEGAQTGTDMESRIEQISNLINLQIYMPDYDEWDGVTPPLVGCYPLDKDDKDIDAITAYDADGTPFVITEMNYRQRPLFILGYSESVENNNANNTQPALNNRALNHSFGDLVYLYGMCIYDTHEGWLKGGKAEIYLSSPAFGRLYLEKVDDASARDEEDPWYTFEDLEDNGLLFEWTESMGTEVTIEVMEDDLFDPDDSLGTITITLESETRAKYLTIDPEDAKLEIGIVPNTENLVTSAPVLFWPYGDQEDEIPWFEWEWPPRATDCNFMLAVLEDEQLDLWSIIDQRPVSEDDYDDIYGYEYPESYIFNPENGFYPYGTQFGWKVQGCNDHGDGPWSDPLEFWFSDPYADLNFSMTVNKLDADGNSISKVYTDLTNTSSINIQTPKTVTVGNTTKTFDKWSYQGNASIKSSSSNSTLMENFASDVTVTAVYIEDCPPTVAPDTSGSNVRGTITNARPTFTWTSVPGATSYTLYVLRRSDNFEVLREINIAGTATSYRPKSELPKGVDLKWKIKGESPCGAGPYSSVINFKIDNGGLPCPPTAAPDTSASNVRGSLNDDTPTFTWTPVPGATSYTLYVIKVADESVVHRAINIQGTSYTPSSPLPAGISLRWKVKSESPCGAGPYSPSVVFSISIYTMSVTHLIQNGNGQSTTDPYTNLSSSSSITISSPQEVIIKDNTGTIRAKLVFEKWYFSGNCTVQNDTSPTAVVKNFGSNVNISASYKQVAP